MKIVELGSYIKQVRGVSYSSGDSIKENKPGYLPILRSNNIEESNINFDDLVYVPKKFVKEYQLLKKGDILITASTGSIKVIGKNGYVKEDYNGSFGAFCKVVRPLGEIDSKYLKHFFQSKDYRRYIKNIVNGANINNIKNGHIDELKIPFPPLYTQKKIAAILDAADNYKQKTKALIEKYDALTQSLFLDMFGDPVTNPKGWKIKKLGLISSMKAGKFVKASEIQSEHGTDMYSCYGGNGLRGFVESFTHEGEFILIGRQGALCGNVKMVNGKFHATEHAIVCTPIVEYKTLWLYHMLDMINLNKYATGAAQPGLNVGTLVELGIMFAPYELQNQFAEQVQSIEAQKAQAQQSLQKAENLFNSLLQKAFKGELL